MGRDDVRSVRRDLQGQFAGDRPLTTAVVSIPKRPSGVFNG
ncbi:hypothetical protein [Mycolicibacterium pyrenivorans]|nr:hypothetical protein [Mycolicibacterium pyrenivorans]